MDEPTCICLYRHMMEFTVHVIGQSIVYCQYALDITCLCTIVFTDFATVILSRDSPGKIPRSPICININYKE